MRWVYDTLAESVFDWLVTSGQSSSETSRSSNSECAQLTQTDLFSRHCSAATILIEQLRNNNLSVLIKTECQKLVQLPTLPLAHIRWMRYKDALHGILLFRHNRLEYITIEEPQTASRCREFPWVSRIKWALPIFSLSIDHRPVPILIINTHLAPSYALSLASSASSQWWASPVVRIMNLHTFLQQRQWVNLLLLRSHSIASPIRFTRSPHRNSSITSLIMWTMSTSWSFVISMLFSVLHVHRSLSLYIVGPWLSTERVLSFWKST